MKTGISRASFKRNYYQAYHIRSKSEPMEYLYLRRYFYNRDMDYIIIVGCFIYADMMNYYEQGHTLISGFVKSKIHVSD